MVHELLCRLDHAARVRLHSGGQQPCLVGWHEHGRSFRCHGVWDDDDCARIALAFCDRRRLLCLRRVVRSCAVSRRRGARVLSFVPRVLCPGEPRHLFAVVRLAVARVGVFDDLLSEGRVGRRSARRFSACTDALRTALRCSCSVVALRVQRACLAAFFLLRQAILEFVDHFASRVADREPGVFVIHPFSGASVVAPISTVAGAV